jgi:hypothetical protein
MTDQKDSGFNIPAPVDSAPAATTTGTASGPGQEGIAIPVQAPDTSARELMFGGGALLVFVVVFFIARNAYANMLVSTRVSPRSANAAGWWLYILLLSLATIGVLAVLNHVKYLTLVYVLPLAIVGVVALILTLVSSQRR